MNPELEALLRAWQARLEAREGIEAERLLSAYESSLDEVCARRKVKKEALDRAVRRTPTSAGNGPTIRSFPKT